MRTAPRWVQQTNKSPRLPSYLLFALAALPAPPPRPRMLNGRKGKKLSSEKQQEQRNFFSQTKRDRNERKQWRVDKNQGTTIWRRKGHDPNGGDAEDGEAATERKKILCAQKRWTRFFFVERWKSPPNLGRGTVSLPAATWARLYCCLLLPRSVLCIYHRILIILSDSEWTTVNCLDAVVVALMPLCGTDGIPTTSS